MNASALPIDTLTGVARATSQLRNNRGATTGTASRLAASAVTGMPSPPRSTSGVIPAWAAAQTHREARSGPALRASDMDAMMTRAAANENWKLPSKSAAGLRARMNRPATERPAKESESLPSSAAPKASDAMIAARTDEIRKPAMHMTLSATSAAHTYLLRLPAPQRLISASASTAAEPTCKPATDTRCDSPQDLRSFSVAASMSSSRLMVTPSINPATSFGNARLKDDDIESRTEFTTASAGLAPPGITRSAVRIDATP